MDDVDRRAGEFRERDDAMRRFLVPQLAELIVSSQQEQLLDSHRREIAAVFADMRNSTGFADTTEPEVLQVMREYHGVLSEIIIRHQGTIDNIAGDGMLVFFNDPFPVCNPAECAVRMAIAMRDRVLELQNRWHRRGFNLGFGVGIALGFATMGVFGSEDFSHYGGVGTVLNLAARLSDEAKDGQILISQRVLCDIEELLAVEVVGEFRLKGIAQPVTAYNVLNFKRQSSVNEINL